MLKFHYNGRNQHIKITFFQVIWIKRFKIEKLKEINNTKKGVNRDQNLKFNKLFRLVFG